MKQPFDVFQEKNLFSDFNFEKMLYQYLGHKLSPFSLGEVLLALGETDSRGNRSQLSDFLVIKCLAFFRRCSVENGAGGGYFHSRIQMHSLCES